MERSMADWSPSPNESQPWVKMSQTLQQSGDLAKAIKALEAAFGAEPTNAQLLWDRAQLLEKVGREKQARRVLQQIADNQGNRDLMGSSGTP